jgi:hypothetical protein
MPKNDNVKKLFLGSLAFIVICSSAIRADQVWYGDNTPDVLDENLTISSNCRLVSENGHDFVHITAIDRQVNVFLTQSLEPTVVEGTYQVPTLFLEPKGFDIIFHIDRDLKFLGAAYTSENYRQPLLIVVRGGHKVVFEIDGKNITFDANVSNDPDVLYGGSVNLYVIMDGSTVQFNRTTLNSSSLSIITLGYEASFGYASNQLLSTTGVGSILFDPTNAGIGRMALAIYDKASVLVSGRYTDLATSYSLTLDDIDKTTAAGCQAIFGVQNIDQTDGCSGLLILNSNATLAPYQIWHPQTFTGETYGFIVSCNGQLSVGALSYLDYVGLTLDTCLTGNAVVPCSLEYLIDTCLCSYNCVGFNPNECCSIPAEKLFKRRNPSALIIDGCCTASSALPACINLEEQAAIVFRSGVNCEGIIENNLYSDYPFTISPIKRTTGAGNMVLDVEGCLTIAGTGTNRFLTPDQTKIEILSLHVTPTGATVLIDGTGSEIFPARDFATDSDGVLRIYNSGYFFINNNVILCKTFLVHTDQNHKVYDNDDVRSEPTYVGGEMYKLRGDVRPKLLFSNSTFMLHTSAATTGFDFVVPNALSCCMSCREDQDAIMRCSAYNAIQGEYKHVEMQRGFDCYPTATCSWECTITPTCLVNASPCDNLSNFIFFYNGYTKDKGTGRQLILGTVPGSMACDCSTVISQDSHLDVMQLSNQVCTCSNMHELMLSVAPNNSTIIEDVPNNITGQYSINTIYLGHASNISIGSPAGQVPEYFSCPTLTINGSYFSFQSRGGILNKPQMSNISGQGGIFVDYNGTIRSINTCGLTMGVMVTKSGNGVISLLEPITHFGCGLGEADWRLDLTETPTIIATGTIIPDYVLNWNTCCLPSEFLPFSCNCTICPGNAATPENVNGAPVVLGEVDQLIVRGARIGDPATIRIGQGGNVRELIFADSCRKGEAAAGVIVLEDDGIVGLGSAHTNVDSLYGSVVLGNNGVTIIANGDGRVHLNEDLVINNVCHIVRGPDFTSDNRLLIESDCCRTILVKSSGILDLGSFTGTGGSIQFGGQVKLILEPGAVVNMGSCTLQFLDDAGVVCKSVSPDAIPTIEPTSLHALDDVRVKFIGGTDSSGAGQGTILFDDCSYCIVDENSFLGVETGSSADRCGMCTGYTNIKIELRKKAKFLIGKCMGIGGAFQVGDTCCTDNNHSINFELVINGNEAEFYIGQGAFVGLGVVITSKIPGSAPNDWYIGTAGNINKIGIDNKNGVFSHNIIWDGNDITTTEAYMIGSLLAIGTQERFTLDFTGDENRRVANLSRSTMRGGGNLMLIDSCPTPTQPDIQCMSNSTVGIMASGPLYKTSAAFSGSGTGLFNFWKYADIMGSVLEYNSRVDIGPFVRNTIRAGYVDSGTIVRSTHIKITGAAGATTDQMHALDIGAAAASLISCKSTVCTMCTRQIGNTKTQICTNAKARKIQDLRILA